MNKLMTVVAASVCAVSLSGSAVAAEGSSTEKQEPEALEEEESALFEAGFDFDFFSAYVWRNAVQTDRMVMQPCVWADLTALDPFWFGFSIWQNYDLTDRRRGQGNTFKHALNETDYNVHAGVTAWSSDDEETSLGFEVGHEWYTYNGRYDEVRTECPDTRELYLKATFDNPFVNVYGQISWMYGDFGDYLQALHYELGFKKEIEVCDAVTLGADWNVNFGDGRYLYFLYGGTPSGAYDHSDDPESPDVYDDYADTASGFGGTTVKLYASWALTEWLSLKGTIAYTGVVNGDLRDSLGEQGADAWYGSDGYPRDLLWGGFSLNIEF